MANKMNVLLDKIERRLGTKAMNLPDHLKKEEWAEVIKQDSLDTFSRYFPNKMRIYIDTKSKQKDGFYLIDENLCDSVDIIGVRDIAWDEFARDSLYLQQSSGYGLYDIAYSEYSMEDVMLLQARADMTSLFNTGIYVNFQPPNRIKLTSVTGAELSRGVTSFPVDLLIKHADNLMTLPVSMMETFEQLALTDVAGFLYNELINYDGLPTVYADIDLKLDRFKEQWDKREELVNYLNDSHVSAANRYMPIILCQ